MLRMMTTETPLILIEQVQGDLSLRGWNRTEVLVNSDDSELEMMQTETGVRVIARDDASLQVPMNASVQIRQVQGDASVNAIGGTLTLDAVDGDLAVSDCGPLTIGTVNGDLAARTVRGDCRVGNVSGDAAFRQILGSLTVENVSDDLEMQDVRGSVRAIAGDDVSLRLLLLPGCTYDVRAGNDIACRIQAEANARVEITCGNNIHLRRLDMPQQRYTHHAAFTLGPGGEESQSTLALNAGDNVTLVGLSLEEMADLTLEIGADVGMRAAEVAQHIAAQLESSVSSIARRLDEKLSQLGSSEDLAAHIQEKVQGALRKAEERVSEAMRNAEMRTKEAERRAAEAEKKGGHGGYRASFTAGWPPPPPAPPKPPKPARPPVSEDERMMVLRMVSEGKISVEQAEKLLAALNGQTPPAER